MLIIDDRFVYGDVDRDKRLSPACWIRVYDLVGGQPDTHKTRVAVFCELDRDDYHGVSVTNGAEYIVTALWEQRAIHPDRTVYVEHYPDERSRLARLWRNRRL